MILISSPLTEETHFEVTLRNFLIPQEFVDLEIILMELSVSLKIARIAGDEPNQMSLTRLDYFLSSKGPHDLITFRSWHDCQLFLPLWVLQFLSLNKQVHINHSLKKTNNPYLVSESVFQQNVSRKASCIFSIFGSPSISNALIFLNKSVSITKNFNDQGMIVCRGLIVS